MAVGDPGNESHQHVPGFPANRIQLGKDLGGYDRSRTYDPSTPASNTFTSSLRSDFSKDCSQGRFMTFLQSPRVFWMHYIAGFSDSLSSASFTINGRIGDLAEAATDQLRAATPVGRAGTLPFFDGTPLEDMRPFVHPTLPNFTNEILGRNTHAWLHARQHGILYQRPTDPHPMLNVYGMPDDLLEFEDEDGQLWLVLIDYKSTSSSKWTQKVDNWFDVRKDEFHRAYMAQLEFYAWMLERIIARDGLPHRMYPVGYHVAFNAGHGGQTAFTGSDLSLNIESAVISHEMDWTWIEPTLDLAIECLLDSDVPPKQPLPNPPNSRTGAPSTSMRYHDFDVMDSRYAWMQTNHPGSWP